MLLIMSSAIYDQEHGHVLLISMGKTIDGQAFTSTNAAGYLYRTVFGSRAFAPLICALGELPQVYYNSLEFDGASVHLHVEALTIALNSFLVLF